MRYATLFSGVGGWDQGLEAAGLGKPLWMCEIGTFQRKVLAHRYPGVPVYEDVTRLHAADAHVLQPHGSGPDVLRNWDPARDGQLPAECPDCITERPDILVASPPCQDLSVAGKRAGLAGVRSGLFFDFVRLVRELQPTWLLMEQVPGLLSSNGGADFGIAIDALADAGYFVEWRVLDARWFGVPQRRRRVFVVGHLGGPPARSVLFESQGSAGHPQTSGTSWEDVAGTLGGGPPGARGWRGDLDSSGAYIPEVGRALTGTMGKRHDDDTDTLVATTLTSGANGRAGRRQEDDTNLVPTLLTMREGKDGGGKGPLISEDQRLTLATGNGQVLFDTPLGFDLAQITSKLNYSNPQPGDPQPPLNTLGQQHVAVAASVRRLTPEECETLMGWPRGWTCLCDQPHTEERHCSDGPRYAAAGNGVVASCAEWIGKRLMDASLVPSGRSDHQPVPIRAANANPNVEEAP